MWWNLYETQTQIQIILDIRRREVRKSSCTQPAFTCSKLTIETLEQVVQCVQSYNKDTRSKPMAFHTLF